MGFGCVETTEVSPGSPEMMIQSFWSPRVSATRLVLSHSLLPRVVVRQVQLHSSGLCSHHCDYGFVKLLAQILHKSIALLGKGVPLRESVSRAKVNMVLLKRKNSR